MTVVNLTTLTGRDVFTRNAQYVGKVEDTMLDSEKGCLYGFAVKMSKNSYLYGNVSQTKEINKTILIPYREVLACDDIVIVTVPKKLEEKAAPEELEDDFIPGITEED